MSDELLPYYQRELAYIRTLGAEFAQRHPKIASRLRLREEGTQDPHVERLIEAFAYLTGRIRFKLEDDFPEIAHALLDVLYPHHLAPTPSMAIAKMTLDASQAELTSGYEVPKGTLMESAPIQGEPCRFRTCYPVTLWPIEIAEAELVGPPFQAPATSWTPRAQAVLSVTLRCLSPDVSFAQLELDTFRFFLQAQPQQVYPLYELIFNNTMGVALATSAGDNQPTILSNSSIRPVGFERDEGMLPYASRSFIGYRLLTEFFAFPDKFLFFDLSLSDVHASVKSRFGNTLSLFFYLDRSLSDLEHHVTRDTLQLGCTPIVNLFRQRAEPIRLTHTEAEYRVVPDARRPLAMEVCSVDRVMATSPDNAEVEYRPFFSFKHASASRDQTRFWYASRRPSASKATTPDYGTELYLTLVDLGFSRSTSTDWTLDVETTCLNRDLPHRLPFGGGEPFMQLTHGGPVTTECLTPPTPTLRPALRHGVVWRLISHLSLNHLSLCDYEEGADALREILKLYDLADSEDTRLLIDGIRNVASRRVVARAGHGPASGLCRGIEVTVHLDEDRFVGSGAYLFGSVLERFLGLYCSINSFTQLVTTTSQREGVLKRWPPRSAEKTLL